MEAAVEEVAAPPCPNKDLSPIAKGKRTKRHRPHSPLPFTITPHTTASSEESTTTAEEDTARCLILLATGHFFTRRPPPLHTTHDDDDDDYRPHNYKNNTTTSKRSYLSANPPTPKAAAGSGGATVMYACKTCNRAFHSFQALGGHRASHKKPKNEKKSTIVSDEEDFPSPSISSSRSRISDSISLQVSNISPTTTSFSAAAAAKSSPSPRIHECSYCGAEFTSGQALGGHMRRHRGGPISPSSYPPPPATPSAAVGESKESKEQKKWLSLDLNLPAPDDHENPKSGLSGWPQPDKMTEERQRKLQVANRLVLSTATTNNTTPAMVDCNY